MEWLRGEGLDIGINSTGQPTTSVGTIQTVENLNILERIESNLLGLLAGSREEREYLERITTYQKGVRNSGDKNE